MEDSKKTISGLRELLKQSDVDKQQLQASYDEALQALADSEAKRETAERELKIAQDQMSTMWKELDSLHKRLNNDPLPNKVSSPSNNTVINEGSLELNCTLCNEKIKSVSLPSSPKVSPTHSQPKTPKTSRLWPFGSRSKPRINQLDNHSKICSSQLLFPQQQKTSSPSPSHSPKPQRKGIQSRGLSPQVQADQRLFLRVNVTRTPTAATDLAPFKVVTKTTMPQFKSETYEVYRSAGDFQWLHDVLEDSYPERIIPPLRTTISLDATVSEYQRFLSRLVLHKTLQIEQPFIIFLTGSIEELRILRAKFRPRLPSEEYSQYRPTQGRDTSSGALVATKDYLRSLEKNILGLVQYLQQKSTETEKEDTLSYWFHQISNSEPCDTYVKIAASDLARTCEALEIQRNTFDGDDALCVQNLQSIADYIQSAVNLLSRVEQAVDKFLFWDEEVMIYEAVTSSPSCDVNNTAAEEVFDDSGISSISGSTNSHHNDGSPSRRFGDDSISEKWAQASSNCSDAKEYLEMICRDLSDELSQFDLQKEKELRQVFLDLASSQLDKNEKLQGKWYAMQCLLDIPIKLSLRAIQFVSNSESSSIHEDQSKRK